MWNWKSWIWPGIVTIAAVGLVTIWFETDPVETDLAGRSRDALASAHPFAKVVADGRDITLSGLAPSEEAQSSAITAVAALRGVRVVNNRMGLLPIESPYRFTADKGESGIALSGFMPGETVRDRLKATLGSELPGIPVSDNSQLARGAAERFGDLLSFGIRQLGRMGTGGFSILDDKLTLTGSPLSAADYAEMAADVAENGDLVGAFDVSPPAAQGPYGFKVEISAQGMALSGHVPGAGLRENLIKAAGAGAADGLQLASGVPEGVDWEQATATAIEAAGQLASGSVSIEGDRLDISGDAVDGPAFKALQALLAQPLPGGLKLGSTDIGLPTVDPFTFAARLDAESLLLEGHLPSEELRSQLMGQAAAGFGNLQIRDETSLANGAPGGFEMLLKNALLALSRMDSGAITVDGTKVSVSGQVFGAQGQSAIDTFLETGLPDGFSGSGGAQLKPGPEEDATLRLESGPCQELLDELGERNTVLFETGSANIRADSFGFLDRMAYVVRRCAGIGIEVAGHTDSDGSEEQNQLLSEARAGSVAAYLAQGGVDADRLAIVGYGESRPRADNGTEEGKAQNRRIELKVRG